MEEWALIKALKPVRIAVPNGCSRRLKSSQRLNIQ